MCNNSVLKQFALMKTANFTISSILDDTKMADLTLARILSLKKEVNIR